MTNYERHSLLYFLLIYLGSLFLVIAVIAWHYFHMQKRNIENNLEYRMQYVAGEIARDIVSTHMHGGSLKQLTPELKTEEFRLGLFAFDDQPLYSTLQFSEKPKETFSHRDGHYLLLHRGTFDHLDVNYLILESEGIEKQLQDLHRKLFIGVLVIILFISTVGFFLAKLFLRPVRTEMERIDRFVKNSTHELNTPIAALLMSVKSLQKEQQDNKKLRRIEISARRISDIYKDLTFLLLKSDQPREDTLLQLDTLLYERLEYFTPLAESKQLIFETKIESTQITIEENRAVLLLDNLLSNAIKYSPTGGQIRITLQQHILTIEDEGPGIPEENREEIFKRYARLDQANGGFGIGLHIVKGICDEYSFDLTVKGSPLGGSCFTIKLT